MSAFLNFEMRASSLGLGKFAGLWQLATAELALRRLRAVVDEAENRIDFDSMELFVWAFLKPHCSRFLFNIFVLAILVERFNYIVSVDRSGSDLG